MEVNVDVDSGNILNRNEGLQAMSRAGLRLAEVYELIQVMESFERHLLKISRNNSIS